MVNYIEYTEKDERGQRHMAARPVRSQEEYIRLRNSPQNRSQVARIRKLIAEGAEESWVKREKFRLVKFAYNDLMPDGRVKDACHPSSTFFHDIDLTDPAMQAGAIIDKVLAHRQELGLLMLERSVSGGLHLVCRRQQGRTVLENQVRVAMLLQEEMDTNKGNLERIVLTTTADDLLFLDPALFEEPMNMEESEKEFAGLMLREQQDLEEVPEGAKKADKHYRPWAEEMKNEEMKNENKIPAGTESENKPEAAPPSREGCTKGGIDLSYRGLPYTTIIAEYWRNTGGEPVEGERNVKLYQLAVNLRSICDNRREVLSQVMPRYGLTETEMAVIIDSACKEVPKGISRTMRQVVKTLMGAEDTGDEIPEAEGDEDNTGAEGELLLPALPATLSPLMALYADADLDECFKPAVLMSVFSALATHLTDVRFADNATLCVEPSHLCLLMAPPQAGKSCINAPLEATNADIQARDDAYRAEIEAWGQQTQQLGSNERRTEEPKRPVQLIMNDVTPAAFLKRLVQAQPSFLYSKMDEIELLAGMQVNGHRGIATQLLRLAYDTAPYGAERATPSGVSGKAPLRWNLSISTTLQNGRRFLGRQSVADGTLSRLSVCTIQRPLTAEKPHFGHYGEAFRLQLRPYILRLVNAKGTYCCSQAVDFYDRLRVEIVEHINQSDDAVALAMFERGIVNAFKRAMVLYIAEGAWSPEIEQFARWSFYYDLACKRLIFGDFIKQAMKGEEDLQKTKPGPENLLKRLTDTFCKADLIKVRLAAGLDSRTAKMLYNWKDRGYIIEMDDGRYQKIPRG